MVHIRTVRVRFCYSLIYFHNNLIVLLLIAYDKYFFILLYIIYLNL
jgi:hypothetical protein